MLYHRIMVIAAIVLDYMSDAIFRSTDKFMLIRVIRTSSGHLTKFRGPYVHFKNLET